MIGESIKRLRQDAGMTQTDLAYELEVDHATLSHWEHGDREPSDEAIESICEMFGVTPEELRYGVLDR